MGLIQYSQPKANPSQLPYLLITRDHIQMQNLKALAHSSGFQERITENGIIQIQSLRIQFPPASPRYPSNDKLPKTYRSKPLVVVADEILFGELAILRYLQMDGWQGVWVDTFHGRGKKKVLWSGMPPNGYGNLTSDAEALYDNIVQANDGKSSGFFDVFAWKNGEFVFIEYKGAGDSSNQNEMRWINAALKCGVQPEELFFVTY
jgi:hypothetical protein